MTGQGMQGADPDRVGAPIAAPRIPRLHLPYLLVVSISLGLGVTVLMLANLSTAFAGVLLLLLSALFVLHLLWLFRLFRDAEGVLQGTLAIGSVAVLVISLLTFWLVPLWASIFFWMLLRSEERAAKEVDSVESAEIGRCTSEGRGLVFAASAYLVVWMVTSSQWLDYVNLYTGGQPELAPAIPLVDALGLPMTIVVAAFHLMFVAYYVRVVGQAVPALYRAHRLLLSRRWSPPEDEAVR